MRLPACIATAAALVVAAFPAADAGAPQQHRVLTISATCLMDDDAHRTRGEVLASIDQAGSRQRHDLIVTPLAPFLSFREGEESADLEDFAALARRHETFLAIALTEKATDDRTFCTALLLDRQGKIVGKYRKTHALPDDTMALGDELPVFTTEIGTIGLSLGTDIYFPELYTVEWMKGAEILVWQHFPERFREDHAWPALLKARCLDNHAHFVAAMYADPRTYIANRHEAGWPGAAWGRSMVLNRVGVALADTGHDAGVATAVVDLDKRKVNAWAPYSRVENIFYVNNAGDRTAFRPLTQPWQKPILPKFKKRTARIAVAHFFESQQWEDGDGIPQELFRAIDDALRRQPDLVLLSEMGARRIDEKTDPVVAMVAERARKAGCYILIGGLDTEGRRSNAWLWDREGKIVFREPIYWTEGFPEIKTYDTDFARIGVHQCGDLYLGEIDRVLALQGAEIILDPSHMWGADGHNNQSLLQARAIDNGCWMACAHTNTSDAWMRSLVVDPYGYVMGASAFQHVGAFCVDVDFDRQRVYYAGSDGRTNRSPYGPRGDLPEQRPGWREMIFARRRPELYGILPTTNAVTDQYRHGPQNPAPNR